MRLTAGAVFHLTYTRHELRRRSGRTIITALGLALGVGLVIGIVSVTEGLDEAQDQVLAPLGSVGTDILVTRVAGQTEPTGATPPVPGGPAGFFGGRDGGRNGGLNRADTDALLQENRNVVTDLSNLGEPGQPFTRDFFLSATLMSFPEQAVTDIAAIPGVKTAVGGLVQLASHQTGTVPAIVASIQTGGETFSQTVRPEPISDAEQAAVQQCLVDRGLTVPGGAGGLPGAGGGAGRGPGRPPGAIEECLPQRFREFRTQFTTPLRTIQQVVDPPSTDITSESYTAAGIDPGHPDVGLVTREQLTAGTWLGTGAVDRREVLVNVAYANANALKVGGTRTINDTEFTIAGLVNPTLTGSTADLYFSLADLQDLATKQGRVTQVLVQATDAGSVDEVAEAVRAALPGSEVVTTAGLAAQVTGSLADARSLANRLGGALAVIVLVAAFAIAALLTLSSVAKRVREIGTLRAIGWSKGRVVRQVVGEAAGIGVIGGLLGVGVGVLVSLGVEAMGPSLSATSAALPGIASSNLATLFGQQTATSETTRIAMEAPLRASILLLGVGIALLGGLFAGLVGGWRAARLSPAVALRDIG